jgi:ubiquinol-cytochrome c reductase core subunit 2
MLPILLRRLPPRSSACSLLSRRGASTSASVSQLSPNIKVAAVEDGAYTASLSVILKAGSRYETAAGVANVLKNSAFKVSDSLS